MGHPVDMIGQRFGRLAVVSRGADYIHSNGKPARRWVCVCDCGTQVLTYGGGLRSGHTKSCGCLQKDVVKRSGTTHGKSKTGTYSSWAAMWSRCTNPHYSGYKDYGGRGISVCEQWRSFEQFLADMGERPPGMSIDRREVMGNYTPANCKWSTKQEQENNKRNSVFVTIGGKTLTYSQWARELGGDPGVLRQRYLKFGSFEPQPRDYGTLKRNGYGQYKKSAACD